MNGMISPIKQYALALFCGLTIALTFATTLLPLPGEVAAVVMVFIPALMAISLMALSDGKAGVRSLLGKLVQWRISLKWVVMALVLALVMRLTLSLIALGYGIILEQQSWLLAGFYLTAAIIIAMIAGPSLARKPVAGISRSVESVHSGRPLARK